MNPPFSLNAKMLNLCTEIAQLLGQLEGLQVTRVEPKLRKSNRVRTIQSSLAIEGNTLAVDQVTAILEGKRVIGQKREIREVQNAIQAYDQLASFKPYSCQSLRKAHSILMKDLIPDAGEWRRGNVRIFTGNQVAHAAPQAKRVPQLMDQLFSFIKTDKQAHPLILSAICHYELEFIHPFSDGNGRLGRLWQTVLLSHFHPIFKFTPLESMVRNRQEVYYQALGLADKMGEAGPFIEFSLETILESLQDLAEAVRPKPLTVQNRLEIAQSKFQRSSFSRKDYLNLFKSISTATASRDLAYGVKQSLLESSGEKALTSYRFRFS